MGESLNENEIYICESFSDESEELIVFTVLQLELLTSLRGRRHLRFFATSNWLSMLFNCRLDSNFSRTNFLNGFISFLLCQLFLISFLEQTSSFAERNGECKWSFHNKHRQKLGFNYLEFSTVSDLFFRRLLLFVPDRNQIYSIISFPSHYFFLQISATFFQHEENMMLKEDCPAVSLKKIDKLYRKRRTSN